MNWKQNWETIREYNEIKFDTILERVEVPYGYGKRVGGLRFA